MPVRPCAAPARGFRVRVVLETLEGLAYALSRAAIE
jgi:hypothetical protein